MTLTNKFLGTLRWTALCLATPAWAGSVIEMESRALNAATEELGTVVISVEGEALRMDTNGLGGDSGTMLFNGAANEMTAVDHASRQYFVIDEAALQSMAGQMGAAMREMEAALAELPPEQRAMAEQMMKQRMGGMGAGMPEKPAPTVVRTGDDETVNGYDCEIYEVSENGRLINELCVAAWGDIEGGREFADGMKRMAGFFEQMRETFAKAGAPNMMQASDNVLAHLEEMDGFPVRSRTYEGDTLIDETTIVSSESKSLEDEIFAPPADYRQQSMRF